MRLREHRHGLFGKVNDVTTPVLGSRCGQGPEPLIQIDLIPGHLFALLAPLTGQREKLNPPTKRPADLAGCLDHSGQLVVAENSITRDLPIARLNAERWR